ncbi:MAG: N-succinylarginine dihydrolase [Myxococcales bacterium]|nr:N-succinylarginine dihydrolase [Myxococcales bacterium]MDH3485391.1 N-succinylarginine dihydrolase [Myxococcales bacterium]
MTAHELSFDGIVGPTHNYSGLSLGNLASQKNVHAVSNPRAAAQQGLRKMKLLHDLGVRQGVLPPHHRPAIDILRKLGFTGRDDQVVVKAQRASPALLTACSSASSMWAANAATVCPSPDSRDGTVHFTPANLRSHFHRQIEAPMTACVLRTIFDDPERFVHHPPLPLAEPFGDEGAANHTRLCQRYGDPGVQLFVYGKRAFDRDAPAPTRYRARQTLEASQAVSRLHELDEGRTVFAQQEPSAIDAGVFHNDVIAVGNQNVFFFHANAFLDPMRMKRELQEAFGPGLHLIEVASDDIPIEDAISSYLFNSQLITLPTGKMALVVPEECRESTRVWSYLRRLVEEDLFIGRVEVVDVRQSMENGGGPACLRLRVVLTEEEIRHVSGSVMLDEDLFQRLETWVDDHYRDHLTEADLGDPHLLDESRKALDELTQVLKLGSLYPFQR